MLGAVVEEAGGGGGGGGGGGAAVVLGAAVVGTDWSVVGVGSGANVLEKPALADPSEPGVLGLPATQSTMMRSAESAVAPVAWSSSGLL